MSPLEFDEERHVQNEIHVDVPVCVDAENAKPCASQRQPQLWGNCFAASLLVLAVIIGIGGLITGQSVVVLPFVILVAVAEWTLGVFFYRRGSRIKDTTITIEKSEQIGGGETQNGEYNGPLYDGCVRCSHFASLFAQDVRLDTLYGTKRLLGMTFMCMSLCAVFMFAYIAPTLGSGVDFSTCPDTDSNCKVQRFNDTIFGNVLGEQCAAGSVLSGLESQFPMRALGIMGGVPNWAFVNIGTTMLAIIFSKHADPNILRIVWAASIAFTIVVFILKLNPSQFTGSITTLVPLVIALNHAFHTAFLEVGSEPRCFGRCRFSVLWAFVFGFFCHFVCGLIIMLCLRGMDTVITVASAIPGAALLGSGLTTTMMSLLVSFGETILQTLFAAFPEVPLSAVTLQIAAYQFSLYGRMRAFFVTLTLAEVIQNSVISVLMDLILRSIMIPVKARRWNSQLKKHGRSKQLEQEEGVYLVNLMCSTSAEHVAILMSTLMLGVANPVVWRSAGSAVNPVSPTTLTVAYFSQVIIKIIGDILLILMVMGFFKLRFKTFFATMGPLFYFGAVMTIFVGVAVGFVPAENCYYCASRDACLAYIVSGKYVE